MATAIQSAVNIPTIFNEKKSQINDAKDWSPYINRLRNAILPNMYLSKDTLSMINDLLINIQFDLIKLAESYVSANEYQVIDITSISNAIKICVPRELIELIEEGARKAVISSDLYLPIPRVEKLLRAQIEESGFKRVQFCAPIYLTGALQVICKHILNVAANNAQKHESSLIKTNNLIDGISMDNGLRRLCSKYLPVDNKLED